MTLTIVHSIVHTIVHTTLPIGTHGVTTLGTMEDTIAHGTIADTTIHGTTAVIGEDGTTRSAIGDHGDGMTHGTMVDIGVATGVHITHGIRTMPDGTADSVHFGDMDMVRDSDTEDISQATRHIPQDMRHRMWDVQLRPQKRPL